VCHAWPPGCPKAHLAVRIHLIPSMFVITWIFNPWGSADLVNAFYQANLAGLLAGQLGATYFIPTFVVPLLPITHGSLSGFFYNIKRIRRSALAKSS